MTVEAVGVEPVQVQQKKTGGTTKAVASAFVPGLGQFMDGRNAAGAGFLAGTLGLGATGGALLQKAGNDVFEAECIGNSEVFNAKSTLNSAIFDAEAGAKIPEGPLDTIFDRAKKAKAEAVAKSPEVAKAREALRIIEESAAKKLETVTKAAKKYQVAGALAILTAIGLSIYNIVDAYKGKKEA